MQIVKFSLYHKSSETGDPSFNRHILKYVYIIWSQCTQYEDGNLEKIQLGAAGIATGASKFITKYLVYESIAWETLK